MTAAGDVSNLPVFPEARAIVRDDKPLLDSAFSGVQPVMSEFSFAYQWIWADFTDCRLTRVDDVLLLVTKSGSAILPPVTADDEKASAVIRDILEDHQDVEFIRVPETLAERLDGLNVVEEPERSDYVYACDDLRELPGRRYRGKRNHVLQFHKAYPHAEYRQMDASLEGACIEFCHRWRDGHVNHESAGLQREAERAAAMLQQRKWLGLEGGVLTLGDRVAAFTLGEPINDTTYAIRVEKADSEITGAYQVINKEFACDAARSYCWINREQDLGLQGLRRAKLSYHPHHMVKKFRVSASAG